MVIPNASKAGGIAVGDRACAACGTRAAKDARFCTGCGAPLLRSCTQCGTAAAPDHRFCAGCGAPLREDAPGRPEPDVERRLVTVMFCDLVRSSVLAAELDPEEYAALLAAYRERCDAAIVRHGGYVSRNEGDGVLACFGYPRAMERDAYAAVACALECAIEVASLGRATMLPGGRQLALRIGIETGLLLATRLDADHPLTSDGLVGTALNAAARLQHLADPNGVVIGEATRELVSNDFVMEAVSEDRLAHLEPPLAHAFRVIGPVTRGERQLMPSPRRTPLIGRTAELATLLECWRRAQAGEGQAVLLSGEPGMGKSRLVQEMLDAMVPGQHALAMFACAPQTATTPLHPVLSTLRDTVAGPAELDALIEALGLAGGPAAGILAEHLGFTVATPADLTANVRRRVLMDTLQSWLLLKAREQPLAVIVEDVHWADHSTLEWLQELASLLQGRRALLVATYRTDFILPWPDRPSMRRLVLASLATEEADQLLDLLHRDIGPAVRDTILARADGVPLFIEEFALAVRTPTVPRTLQQLFTARLDALGEAKRLAQCISVFGRVIEHDVLAALSRLPEFLIDRQLAQLVAAEVLVRTGLSPVRSYTFRHVLLQDAACASLARSELRLLHSRSAAILAELRPDLVALQPELLAEHYMKAGELAAAAPLFAAAARRALGAAAFDEAEAQLRRGFDATSSQQPVPLELMLELELLQGLVLIARLGPGSHAVRDAHERALRTAETLPDKLQILAPLRGLTSFHQVNGPLSRARELCDRLAAAAEEVGDPCLLVDAWRRRGWNYACTGRLADAEADLFRALGACDPAKCAEHIAVAGDDPRVLGLANLAWLDLSRHGVPAAARRAERAAEAANSSPHALSTCYGLIFAAYPLQLAGRWDEARNLAEGALALAEDKGFAYWIALGWAVLGYDRAVHRGDLEQGHAMLLRGLARYQDTQGKLLCPFVLSLLSEVQAALGDRRSAEATLDDAIGIARQLEADGFLPELLYRRARLLISPEWRTERMTLLKRARDTAISAGALAVAGLVAAELGGSESA